MAAAVVATPLAAATADDSLPFWGRPYPAGYAIPRHRCDAFDTEARTHRRDRRFVDGECRPVLRVRD